VGGNPETANDPTGQMYAPPPGGGGGGGGNPNPPPPPPPPNHGPTCGLDPSLCDGDSNNPDPRHAVKQITMNQLTQWCVLNAGCLDAVGRYQEELQSQGDINSAYLMMGFFDFFHGDPEAFEQAIEEEPNVWELVAWQEHGNLDDEVSADLASSNPPDRVEGEAGAIAELYSKLIRYNQKFGPDGMLGEVDVETPEAIIEAKSGGLAGEIRNLTNKFTNPYTNPGRKPFVIYAPSWSEKNAMTVYETLGSLDTGQDLYVTRNPEELIAVLEYLQEGTPSN
jgi:hypothetical protein